MTSPRSPNAVLLLALISACGARTGLPAGGLDGGIDAAPIDAGLDRPDVTHEAAPPGCPFAGPVTLATNQSPEHIVLDATHVYWVNDDGTVKRVKKTGGVVESVGTLAVPPEFGMAIDDTYVYAGDSEIDRIAKGGGVASPVAKGSAVYGISVDATWIYWAQVDGPVRKAPKAGGGPVIDLAFAKGGATRAETDGAYVYYTTWYPPNGGAWRVPIGGGASEQLASAPYSDYLALDATNLYWDTRNSASGPGSVWTVPKAGGVAVALAAALNGMALAVDDTYVYWADNLSNVSRVPKKGGPTTVLFPNERNARALAIDELCIYWGRDPIDGLVRAGPK